ncbi:macro domain-containing protein [Planococcus citreus]|uniref:O-acetyl-ADP-ribose deacetylase (Regulator of RNase III) n=1 Tax=Planococcus citreus TaxID=1373 RepID=A0A497YEE7_9BACL|nr:macro domain-containing protein [Planococcus citreus]RLJ86665.1 O-acetyl-ADP-ribose deacetylase (regulator of RNase III) [Planococcus citreus]
MPLQIVRNDITKMTTDAIVNAANSSLKMGGGVCGAIFRAAGPKQLQEACDRVGHCAVGEAVHTNGFELESKYIIHTVGPVWEGGGRNEEMLLRNCYRNSLELAIELGCESIAFPLISTGIFGYPKEPALRVATEEIDAFLGGHDMDVYLVVLDKQSFGISQKLYESIEAFIDEQEAAVLEERAGRYQDRREMEIPMSAPIEIVEQQLSLEEFLEEVDESFSQRLFRFIDERGMTDAETYKKANLDKKLFSKIRNSPGYTPKKKTILAFAIALELDIDETEELLGTAGYRLSNSHKFDLIVRYFIEREQYNIFEINEALFAFDEALLGS